MMRLRKRSALILVCVFCVVYIILYFLTAKRGSYVKIPVEGGYAETVNLLDSNKIGLEKENSYHGSFSKNTCVNHLGETKSQIQMLDLYNKLSFGNPDGGAWKQGWNVNANSLRWNANNKLKVFVVPHSHNDPGWKKTFEQYFTGETRYILNNMIKKLVMNPGRKFIWAEISYLSLWWDEASEDKRNVFKKLVLNGQIELVTGGWVMPDEASTHYYSIIQQFMHGHQWMKKNLNVTAKRSWCIDPFGVSSTMPFLLKKLGIQSLVIQRTHYAIKKYFAKNKYLEFLWRQAWDAGGRHDLMTHMMPFYSYDIPHTCGPDPSICCQFDFRRVTETTYRCPWGKNPEVITDRNVAFRANLLLDQYRKKAELFSTNVLLVPLGDDFRYEKELEWNLQYDNYERLFNYMNNEPSLYVEAKFGTLEDYFTALEHEARVDHFPTLSGDFFTYADRDDHYWSGYFTSRPYYKRMDRILLSNLRAAEILHAIAWKSFPSHSKWLRSEYSVYIGQLRQAREWFSLFQHHDSITGTSKDYVVRDLNQKLSEGLLNVQATMREALQFLLSPQKKKYRSDPKTLIFDIEQPRNLPSVEYDIKISVNAENPYKRVVVFNSLTIERTEIIDLKMMNFDHIQVLDANLNPVPYQISPYCDIRDLAAQDCFVFSFEVVLKPLETKTYFLSFRWDVDNKEKLTSLKIVNPTKKLNPNYVRRFPKLRLEVGDFSIENNRLSVAFNSIGKMKSIFLKDLATVVPTHLSFTGYKCSNGRDKCGAYLFLPNGEPRTMYCPQPLIRIIKGSLFSKVIVTCDLVSQAVILYNTDGTDENIIEIQNLVDISTSKNFELAMKFTTNIRNNGIFYTDLNGFQMTKRKFFQKLPTQANYYPMPTSVYIEDDSIRLTFVSAQPLGVTSMSEGQIEIMQDRRLLYDDDLGLGEGVTDNKETLNVFRLIVEKQIPRCQKVPESHAAGYLSVMSYVALQTMLYPLVSFVQRDAEVEENFLKRYMVADIPNEVDMHLVSMTTMADESAVGILLHRVELDMCYPFDYQQYQLNSGEFTAYDGVSGTNNLNSPLAVEVVNVTQFIPLAATDTLHSSPISFTYKGEKLMKHKKQTICKMELTSFCVAIADSNEVSK